LHKPLQTNEMGESVHPGRSVAAGLFVAGMTQFIRTTNDPSYRRRTLVSTGFRRVTSYGKQSMPVRTHSPPGVKNDSTTLCRPPIDFFLVETASLAGFPAIDRQEMPIEAFLRLNAANLPLPGRFHGDPSFSACMLEQRRPPITSAPFP
jgi:hypothetical protein